MTLQDILRDVDFFAEQLRQIDFQEAELVEQAMLVHEKLNSTANQNTKLKVLGEELQDIIGYFSSSASPRRATLGLVQNFQERFTISSGTTTALTKNLFSRAVSPPNKKTKPGDHHPLLRGDWFFEVPILYPVQPFRTQKEILRQIFLRDSGYVLKELPSPETTYIPYNTNPRYGQVGYNTNCARVVNAYELRRRGYDVTANKRRFDGSQRADECTGGWVNPKTGKSAWDEKELVHVVSGSEVSATQDLILRKFGVEGARGAVSVMGTVISETKGPGGESVITKRKWGHIFSWEVLGGKVAWIDAQTNEIGDVRDEILSSSTENKIKSIAIYRFDDKEPTLSLLQYLETGWT